MTRPARILGYVAVAAALLWAVTYGYHGYEQRQLARALPTQPDLQRWPVELSQRIAAATRDAENPGHTVAALSDLALLYFANGFGRESAQVLNLLVQRDPKNPRWPYLQGILEERAGRRDDAITSFRTAARLAPDYAPARTHLEKGLLAVGPTNAARASLTAPHESAQTTASAIQNPAKDGGQFDGAPIQPLVGSQATAPDDDPYVDEAYAYSYDTYRLQSFGEMRLVAQRYPAAIFFLRRAVTVDPRDAAVQASLAVAYLSLHQLSEARQVLEAALQISPGSDVLLARLVEVMIGQKEPDAALARLEQIWPKDGSASALLFNARGESLAAMERWPEAAAAFAEAAKINPVAPEFQLNLASAYLHGQQPELAAQWADRALKLHPGDLRGLALSTAASVERSRFDEALETARALLAQAAVNREYRALYTSVILQAGNQAMEKGDEARAETLYREGLAADSANGDLHGALGVLLSIHRDFANARAELETFQRLAPSNPLPYLLLGSSLSDSGQAKEAQAIWEQGLQAATAARDENRIAQLRAVLER